VTEKELREHLKALYPKEDEGCDWKAFTNLKNAMSSKPGEDVESYVSAIANMKGGHLVVGVKDKTLDIVGIQNFHNYTVENIRPRLAGRCAHLNSEKLRVEPFKADDTGKVVWVIHIPQHEPRLPVYAHGKPWQRLGDSLVPMRPERLNAILGEPIEFEDWSVAIVEKAAIADLDETALTTARGKFKERNSAKEWHVEIDSWDWSTFLDKAKLTVNGRITRACLLLLGKRTVAHHLSPHPAQITWKLDAEE
jgi:ATP-dependent DNA helicase RecG